MMRAATIAPVYVANAMKGAIKKGYHPEEILEPLGIPLQLLVNPKLRLSTSDFGRLTHALSELLEDESLGLLANPSRIGTFELIAKACLSADNLNTSLQTWCDATNLLESSVSAQTRTEENLVCIILDVDRAPGTEGNYITEALLTSLHRFHCWLADDFLPIEKVDLRINKPSFSEEHRFVFYGAPVHYQQPQNAIYFSEQTLKLRCQKKYKDLLAFLQQPNSTMLAQAKKSKSLSIRVRLWMEQLFREELGSPQMSAACKYFGMTEQTLRRHLNADGYSFKQLKEDTRRDIAIYYIQQSEYSIEDIGFRLSFSDASTFIRAFKSWTGYTPLAYRKL